MSDLHSIVAGRVGDHDVTLHDLLYTLKISERMRPLEVALHEAALMRAADRLGVTVSDQELQAHADGVRRSLGLLRSEDTDRWLAARGSSVDDFEAYALRLATAAKLKEKVTEGRVDAYFSEHRQDFDGAVISRIVVDDGEQAADIAERTRSGAAAFAAVARVESMEGGTRDAGGHAGFVYRGQLPPAVSEAVFAAQAGDIVGPVDVDGLYHVVCVERLQPAEYTQGHHEAAREQLFTAWLRGQAAEVPVEFTLPAAVGGSVPA